MQEGIMHRLWNRIDFAFSSAWQNFWRNAAVSIASVLIVWVVLLALGSLLLVLHSLDQIVALEKTKASAISVYLADTTPLSSAMDFKLHLEADPRISNVTYVSKDQAMARFRDLPALDPSVIDTLGTNPLPASLDVTVKDIRDLGAIDQEVRNSPLVDKSPATNYEPNVIDKIILLARVAGIAGLALIVGLTGLSVFIIMLTIRTAAGKRWELSGCKAVPQAVRSARLQLALVIALLTMSLLSSVADTVGQKQQQLQGLNGSIVATKTQIARLLAQERALQSQVAALDAQLRAVQAQIDQETAKLVELGKEV